MYVVSVLGVCCVRVVCGVWIEKWLSTSLSLLMTPQTVTDYRGCLLPRGAEAVVYLANVKCGLLESGPASWLIIRPSG